MNREGGVALHHAVDVVQAMKSVFNESKTTSMQSSPDEEKITDPDRAPSSSSSSTSSSTSGSVPSSPRLPTSPETARSGPSTSAVVTEGRSPVSTLPSGARHLVRKRSCTTISEVPEYRVASASSSRDEGTGSSDSQDAQRILPAVAANEVSDSKAQLIQEQNRWILFARLEDAAPKGKLSLINLARQGIGPSEAKLLKQAIVVNPHLSVLKLAYNTLGDEGATVIAEALHHHLSLSLLDIGFNEIGDIGCNAVALNVVAGNNVLSTLYLTGNRIRGKGALSIAGAILHGTGVSKLFIAANRIGSTGLKAIAGAIANSDANLRNGVSKRNNYNDHESRSMEELDLGSTSFDSSGFIAIPGMLLSNASLRSLCLSNNNLDDSHVMLLSQALSQNKDVPLRSLKLSFNQITCQGVECMMNAVWGSATLREICLDNNRIQDRGAQLCAVVLTSVSLEKLDLAFNRVTTLGLKALMKNISENNSLHTLGLSGIPIDLNGSKALSYALAYNSSLRAVYLDNCSTGYSSQRHIVAGIVSNRRSLLRVLTGFSIGPVARTLGMPNLPEQWSNDQVLGFFRLMWQQWLLKSGRGVAPSQDDDSIRGPAPPAAVAAAAKIALTALGSSVDTLFHTEAHEKPVTEGAPVEPTSSALLERTDSGTMRVPSFPDGLDVANEDDVVDKNNQNAEISACPRVSTVRGPLENPERRNRNLQWLRQHFRSLGEVGRLPFNNADLWQLHQYYFSPPFAASIEEASSSDGAEADVSTSATFLTSEVPAVAPPPTPAFGAQRSGLGRAVSFQTLGDALAASGMLPAVASHKRRPHYDSPLSDGSVLGDGPATKRAKSLSKPRIAYYPRIMMKIQSLGTKPMELSLSLLRQLKYAENVIFSGRDPYAEVAAEVDDHLSHSDVEMILLDLL